MYIVWFGFMYTWLWIAVPLLAVALLAFVLLHTPVPVVAWVIAGVVWLVLAKVIGPPNT